MMIMEGAKLSGRKDSDRGAEIAVRDWRLVGDETHAGCSRAMGTGEVGFSPVSVNPTRLPMRTTPKS